MYIKQILNNNTVVALDSSNKEIIASARGIGFNNEKHSIVDENLYPNLKKFILDNADYANIRKAYDDIPQDILDLAEFLLNEEKRKKEFSGLIPITAVMLLADHINETIKRLEKGIYLRNALTNEIKAFYEVEFNVGSKAKDILLNNYSVLLNDDEIAFIATHLINLTTNSMSETLTSIQIVDEIVNIVRRIMNIELKMNTYVYTRFITHLKYFSLRIINKEKINSGYDENLEKFVNANYKKSYLCANTVKNYMKEKYDYDIANEEVIYLTLHLENLRKVNENEYKE